MHSPNPPLCFPCVCVQMVTLYLVKWCSLPYEDSTWELKADIDQSKIEEYESIAARTPNTKRVVSSFLCVCLWVLSVSLPPPSRRMCVGLLPAPFLLQIYSSFNYFPQGRDLVVLHTHTYALLLWPGQTTNSAFNAEQKQLTGCSPSLHYSFLCPSI